MDILIIRHGEAVDEAPGLGDAGRWLTGKGRKVTRKVGRWLAEKAERRAVEIWTSPLVRAVQTAEVVAAELGLVDGVAARAELSPAHDPRDVLRALESAKPEGPVALVGHEPGLSMLATALLGDVGFPGFKKSAVLAVRWKGQGPATFQYYLSPKEMEVVTDLAAIG